MKKTIWIVVSYIAVGLICLIIGRATRKADEVTVSTIDTLLVREFISDTSVITDTVVVSSTDTLIITKETPIGEIPVRTKTTQDSLPVKVQDKMAYLPFTLDIDYRGLLYGYRISTKPRPYKFKIKQPVVDFYGYGSAMVNLDLLIVGELEVGVSFWDRVSLFGKVVADVDRRANMGAGLKVRIF